MISIQASGLINITQGRLFGNTYDWPKSVVNILEVCSKIELRISFVPTVLLNFTQQFRLSFIMRRAKLADLRQPERKFLSIWNCFLFTSCCWGKSNPLYSMYLVASFMSNLVLFSFLGREHLDVPTFFSSINEISFIYQKEKQKHFYNGSLQGLLYKTHATKHYRRE